MEANPTVVTILIGGNSALAVVVVWLALYIRKLHNERMKEAQKHSDALITVTEKHAETMGKMTEIITMVNVSLQSNTERIKENTNFISRAFEKLETTVNDLHKYILSATK